MLDEQYKQTTKNKGVSISEKLQHYIETVQFFDDSIDDYIYIYDLTSGRVFLTDRFREKYPIPPAGDDGNDFNDWNDIVYTKDRHLMDHYRDLLIRGEITSFDINYRILDRAGNKVWVRVKGTLRGNDNAESLLLVGHIAELAATGIVDGLTGLFGIETFMDSIKQSLKQHNGYLMLLGIDNFQTINITQGRSTGDAVLKTVAEALDAHTRYPMEVYRLDGDCFAVNFIHKQQEDVGEFYTSIKEDLADVCTVSAGVVGYKCGDTTDSGTVYLYAETALKQAKKEGKNKMLFFSADDYQKNLEQVELLAELKSCVQENCKGFSLEYQPQVSCGDFALLGVEALLRYQSPSRGRISPLEFIPLLEQTGLICQVGEWVLRTAAAQCRRWRAHIPHLNMSVNMSYIQLQQDGITDLVLNVLREEQLPGNSLTLELTESIQLQNYHYFNKIFYIWKEHGIRISIDDFGTGYSSLSYLKSIEIDEVKIDRCFVDHVQYNTYNLRLLRNMIELAHSAKIEVCCEGVETLEELMALQELHADILQGYFFAKPYTVHDFEQNYICEEAQAYQERKEKESNIRRLESGQSKELLEELRNEEIGNITESMDEMVYVSDIDTYELYYLNAVGRRITGVYDYKGCKCYEVLQGRDKPCEFCSNAKLCKEQFLIWEMENAFLKRHFILKDKLIAWKGRMARVEMAIDITENEILSQAIQKRLNFKRVFVEVCKELSSEADLKESAYHALKMIGQVFECERVYILIPGRDDGTWELQWEWFAQGKDSLKNAFPMSTEQILSQKTAHHKKTPIVRKHETIGFLCVDDPDNWDDMDRLLKAIANFFGYAITNGKDPKG